MAARRGGQAGVAIHLLAALTAGGGGILFCVFALYRGRTENRIMPAALNPNSPKGLCEKRPRGGRGRFESDPGRASWQVTGLIPRFLFPF